MIRLWSLTFLLLLAHSLHAADPLPPASTTPHWIWLATARDKQPAHFRKVIELPAGVVSAKLVAVCDNQFNLFIDDKEVLAGNDWQAPAAKDVTTILKNADKPTRHLLAVRCRNNDGPAGLLVRLTCEVKGARPVVIVSDATWKASEKAPRGFTEPNFNDEAWKNATSIGKLGMQPWVDITVAALDNAGTAKEPPATPAESLKLLKGFRAELLYSVPKDAQGSWVNMCVDPKGRIIVSDQYGGLFRVTPPPIGGKPEETKVEPIPAKIGEAQGLLWAFDRLYVVVNGAGKYASGLYQVTSSNRDDVLDDVKLLRGIQGGGEHGPHAVLLSPDRKSLYIVCGNGTTLVKCNSSRVPTVWGEDHLLRRLPDGNGFMRTTLAPGGCIYNVSPDGQTWELVSTGYRNQYDAAFNRHGDLFTYDADMEWDMNTPWYRPTRVCLASSGSEYGWRNGAGKWPPHYPDTLPAIYNVGPGSPTGVCFGYGARFPSRYQDAFYICDWSYGKLYAVHLTPDGSSYKAEGEEFVAGTPLPLTDVVINPLDGAMYFAIGGRKTKSGLYRVTYVGSDAVEPSQPNPLPPQHQLRRDLEALHMPGGQKAVEFAWEHLSSSDRFVRFAARTAIEHQPAALWQERALAEKSPAAAITALLALVRVRGVDPFHRKEKNAEADPSLKSKLLEAIERVPFENLPDEEKLNLIRVYQVFLNRFGAPSDADRLRIAKRLDTHFPSPNRLINSMLGELLVYLESPGITTKMLRLLADAPTQEEQIDYAKTLRMLKSGWTLEQRREYLRWFLKAGSFKGGSSFGGFIRLIKTDAVATLSPEEKADLQALIDAPTGPATAVATIKPRPFVKAWKLDELAPMVEKGLVKRDFDRGRKLFGEAACFACHRFADEGGAAGPDLTGLAGRFSVRDLLESIVDPNKVISDQYAAVLIETKDGRQIHGRIVNLNGDGLILNTDMLNPNAHVTVDRKRIESLQPSKTSMMPTGLLDTFKEDEILDLMAFLLSRGDRKNKMFDK